jgi:hypothetical protein
VYPIVRFDVYFSTPRGMCTDLGEAIEVCEGMGVDPELNIRPAAVAVADAEGVYELI